MSKMYRPSEIEPKWQKKWEEDKTFESEMETSKPKFYCLDMFPYPSGAGLHVGHMEGYTATDIISRYYRNKGYDVLHPIGFDSFGLPTENYAIKQKMHPAETTEKAIAAFKNQISGLGLSYDWSRELATSNPDYYKWTEWFFLLLYKNGLAYRKEAPVNWCPSCQTVLANEQVIKDGDKNVCERCGSEVIKKNLEQWFFRITKYADKLINDLDKVDWPESVKVGQKNWIGKQEGINLIWKVEGLDVTIKSFTKYPETIFGATFLALAPEHELINVVTTPDNQKRVEEYILDTKKKTEIQRSSDEKKKTGVFTGSYVLNPVNNIKMPIYVADYVLPGYGTGAVFGVPAHDKRDYHFAKKYDIEVKRVIKSVDGDISPVEKESQITEDGVMINSEFLNGLDAQSEAKKKIMDFAEEKGFGERVVFYHLRDWLISRQRYWGSPIPVIYCPHCAHFEEEGSCCGGDCGCDHCDSEKGFETTTIEGVKYAIIPVSEKELPVTLPNDVEFMPTGESPLVKSKSFHTVKCPNCGATEGVRRESDTMDTFVCSSWYYLRFADPKNTKEFASKESLEHYLPVDFYLGGDHVTTHLIYARFFTKVLYDLGMVNFDEPFLKFKFIGHILGEDGRKMSKRWGNVINPTDVVSAYGADTLRTYEMFMGPLDVMKPWSTKGAEGVKRFFNKVWELSNYVIDANIENSSDDTVRNINILIKRVDEDLKNLKLNTAVSSMMEFINFWSANKNAVGKDTLSKFIIVMSPFAPHLAEEVWEMLGNKESISKTSWPDFDPSKIVEDVVTIVVQVNGKLRDRVEVSSESVKDKESIIEKALSTEKMRELIKDGKYKEVFYVEGKILSFVI